MSERTVPDPSQLHRFTRIGRRFAVHVPTGRFAQLSPDADLVLDGLARDERPAPAPEVAAALDELARHFDEPDEDRGPAQPAPMTDLTLNISAGCDLACRYCWNNRGLYGGEMAGRMTPKVACDAVDLLVRASNGHPSLVVDFYGGEPLLNLPVMKAAVEHCRAHYPDRRFSFLLATNGVHLSPENAAWLHDNGVNVALSIDGGKEVQDRQRPLANGSGSYDRIAACLAQLPAHVRADYVARATLTPDGPGPLEAWHQLHDMGFRRIEVFESEPACFYGTDYPPGDFFVAMADRDRLMAGYEALLVELAHRIAAGELGYEDLFFSRLFKQMARLYRSGDFEGPCAAGTGQIAVSQDGTAYPCTAFIGQDTWRMGTVGAGLDASVQRRLLDTDITQSDACQSCWAMRLCLGSGSCYNLSHLNLGRIDEPVEAFCELYRRKIELLIAGLALLQDEAPEAFDRLFDEDNFTDRSAWRASTAAGEVADG